MYLQVKMAVINYYCRYIKEIGIVIIFCALLGILWIAVISLVYAAIYPQIGLKPLEFTEKYPFHLTRNNKSKMCEHYEYFSEYQNDKPFQNVWITLIWSVIGLLVLISTLYGILMRNLHFLDLSSYFFFISGIHKGSVILLLFIKCHSAVLFKYFIFTEPVTVLLSILNVAISMKLIHFIQMVMSFLLVILETKFRNYIVKTNLKNTTVDVLQMETST